MSATQSTKLLSSLFENIDNDQRLTVLHIGPALPETVDFFSRFRCKLYFVDLFSELPIAIAQEDDPPLEQVFSELLHFQTGVVFDICLFWDLFNFLDSGAIAAFLHVLQPRLHADTVAHGFAVHNLKSPQGDQIYGIKELDAFNVRSREIILPGYSPHPQDKLKTMLNCFNFERSVLLPDSRLELLFSTSL